MTIFKRRFVLMLSVIPVLLLVPAIATKISGEVNWSFMDFIVMGALLVLLATAVEIVLRLVTKRSHRLILSIVVLVLFLLTWAELGVGLFGTPWAGN